jgi:hypothetical protein
VWIRPRRARLPETTQTPRLTSGIDGIWCMRGGRGVGALRKGRREGEGGWIDDGREDVGSGHWGGVDGVCGRERGYEQR